MTTLVDEQAALERFLAGVAPYSSGNPVPPPGTRVPSYATAEAILADALGRPALAREVADKLSKATATRLADEIRARVERELRRRVDVEVAARLAALAGVVEAGLDGIPAECEAFDPWEPHEPAPELPPAPEPQPRCGAPVDWRYGGVCRNHVPCPAHGGDRG